MPCFHCQVRSLVRELRSHKPCRAKKKEKEKKTVVRERAAAYFVAKEGKNIPPFRLSIKIDKLLKDFILSGGFDINEGEDDLMTHSVVYYE